MKKFENKNEIQFIFLIKYILLPIYRYIHLFTPLQFFCFSWSWQIYPRSKYVPTSNLILYKIFPRSKFIQRERKQTRTRNATTGFSRQEMQTDILTDIFLAGQSVLLARRTTLRTPRRASANLGKWVNIYIARSAADLPFFGERRNIAFAKKMYRVYICASERASVLRSRMELHATCWKNNTADFRPRCEPVKQPRTTVQFIISL